MPLAQLQVAHLQHRRQAAPAAFQRTDVHRQAQRLFSLALHIGAILGHQRHQFAAQAHIQRHQYRQQSANAQPQRVKATRTRVRRPIAVALQVVYP